MAQGCKKPRCFNCECPGHVASDCDLDPLYGVCLKSGHHVLDCPYLIFSANVEPAANTAPSYADMARQNRPASPVAAPPPLELGQRKKEEFLTKEFLVLWDWQIGWCGCFALAKFSRFCSAFCLRLQRSHLGFVICF